MRTRYLYTDLEHLLLFTSINTTYMLKAQARPHVTGYFAYNNDIKLPNYLGPGRALLPNTSYLLALLC